MGDNLKEARDQLATAIAEVERVDKENAELRAERDALLAQLAAVRANAELWAGSDADQIAPSRGLGLVVLGLLDSAGTDTLAEVKAAAWAEGVLAKSKSSSIFDCDVLAANPYRATPTKGASE